MIWGGSQVDSAGSLTPLPRNVVYFYNPTLNTWRKEIANGTIPGSSLFSAGALCENQLLYIFGGFDATSRRSSNKIYSLNLTLIEFRLLPDSSKKRPSPRYALEGWCFQEKLYFFGGHHDGEQSEDHLRPPESAFNYDNLLTEFDTDKNSWSAVATTGPQPSPRASYATSSISDNGLCSLEEKYSSFTKYIHFFSSSQFI